VPGRPDNPRAMLELGSVQWDGPAGRDDRARMRPWLDRAFARGFMGQFIVVIPSERLVIVRLSVSHVRGDDIGEADRLVADIRVALLP
jgi:CubicO group peptidase (beta-lactamase class C family)